MTLGGRGGWGGGGGDDHKRTLGSRFAESAKSVC